MGNGAKDYKRQILFDEDDVWVSRFQLSAGSAGFAKRDYDRLKRFADPPEPKTLRQLIQEEKSNGN
jgi:hypothetical protein